MTRQLGPALAVERLWRETGCGQVIDALAGEREFQFDVERAVFLTVLHRLFDPGSDRAAEKWRHGLVIDGVADLDLHHLYRAMGWLGEELADQEWARHWPADHQGSRRGAAVRRAQQPVQRTEPGFSSSTTSLYFEGAGGRSLGQYGHSKDHRPDLKQVVLAVVIDGSGALRPIWCQSCGLGNTTDVTTLLEPVIEAAQDPLSDCAHWSSLPTAA